MKKIYTLLVLVFAVLTSNAQIVNIPDAIFKAKLLAASPSNTTAKNLSGAYFKIDSNNDSEIQVTEALEVSYLSFSSYNIYNIIGISNFTNLQYLNTNFCYQITAMDLSNLTNLETLLVANNNLSTLNIFGLINLKTLRCERNHLSSLNLNSLTSLEFLTCQANQIPILEIDNLINLEYIDCNNNQMSTLTLNGLTNLTNLKCNYNQISTLNLNGAPNITILECSNNQISTLSLNGLPNLSLLECSNNQLTSLFVKNGRNEGGLYFNGNPNLQYICGDQGQITSIQNIITTYGYTNCHVNTYCSFEPGGISYLIQGNAKYDSNNNGCNVSDILTSNLKFNIASGANIGSFFTNLNGGFSLPVSSGIHTFSPVFENPSYFNVSPATSTVAFPDTASPFVQDFCVTANGNHNDLEVTILPIGPARPGFDSQYKIIYKNKGTQAQSGSVNLAFNDATLDLISSNPTTNSQASNSLTWNFSNLLSFETREIAVTLNVNSPMEIPAVNDGDILNYTATVTGTTDETPNDNSSTLNQTVVNSYDPNDKTCVEGTSITPSMVGQYVHYVIRFENTGTANAVNVVVRDLIDMDKFEIGTLIPQIGSHPFVTRIINTNQVEFIFENINLPFDDSNNDGYVAFKIKTKPTLVVGNTFSNSASIYFDYNFPIVTDTYTTTIQALSNQDFEFNSVFSLSPVPTKDVLTITAKENVVMTSVSIYNTLGQLVQVNTNPSVTIDVSGLQSGSYFIKITSDKGSANGKFIKE